jgi:hypothetical protein
VVAIKGTRELPAFRRAARRMNPVTSLLPHHAALRGRDPVGGWSVGLVRPVLARDA